MFARSRVLSTRAHRRRIYLSGASKVLLLTWCNRVPSGLRLSFPLLPSTPQRRGAQDSPMASAKKKYGLSGKGRFESHCYSRTATGNGNSPLWAAMPRRFFSSFLVSLSFAVLPRSVKFPSIIFDPFPAFFPFSFAVREISTRSSLIYIASLWHWRSREGTWREPTDDFVALQCGGERFSFQPIILMKRSNLRWNERINFGHWRNIWWIQQI